MRRSDVAQGGRGSGGDPLPASAPSPATTPQDPRCGTVLAGQYRLLRVLGEGGMGRVYLAEQVSMRREVAVKILRVDPDASAERIADVERRFERELMAASRLEHPNTVKVLDFGTTPEGQPFLVMERLRGRTLGQEAQLDDPLAPARALRIAAAVCRSLAEAHHAGIVHRDLTPANVFLTEVFGGEDGVKVLDFGMAKVMPAEPGRAAESRSGEVAGTAYYMAPEQALGEKVTAAADLYALGAILFECLSGQPPFDGETPIAVLMKHANAAVPPLVLRGDIPPDLAARVTGLVRALLSKAPDDRPTPALAVAVELERLAAAIEGSATRLPKRASARTKVVGGAVVALLAGLAGSAWVLNVHGDEAPAERAPAAATVQARPADPAPAPVALPPREAVPEVVVPVGAGGVPSARTAVAGGSKEAGASGRSPREVPACRDLDCPFTRACRGPDGKVVKGGDFCYPTF